MSYQTMQRSMFEHGAPASKQTDFVTVGVVVSTSDPQESGRIKVVCSQWGDTFDTPLDSLPWVTYISPVGGDVSAGTRGPGIQSTVGRVPYGFWAIPRVGSQVVVLCIDGDPTMRAYFGSVFAPMTTNALPHGRFTYDDHPAIKTSSPIPYGPMTSSETPIQPLADNLKKAFGNQRANFEWQTRAADYQVSGVRPEHLDYTATTAPDDEHIRDDLTPTDWISTQGYNTTRYDDEESESKVFSFTSPGFHSWSMDDRQENCRQRIRTTSGHQILLDDTNERIYISTAEGNNWVEMDQNGNIDVYSANTINVHSVRDLNLTSDETVRIQGKKGVHIKSDDEMRIETNKHLHVKVGGTYKLSVVKDTFANIGGASHTTTKGAMFTTSSGAQHYKSGGVLNLTCANDYNVKAGGDYVATADEIFHNDKPAQPATAAKKSAPEPAYWTSRVPAHEPWGRSMTKNDFTHEPEHTYLSKLMNKVERGRAIVRGLFWRR